MTEKRVYCLLVMSAMALAGGASSSPMTVKLTADLKANPAIGFL